MTTAWFAARPSNARSGGAHGNIARRNAGGAAATLGACDDDLRAGDPPCDRGGLPDNLYRAGATFSWSDFRHSLSSWPEGIVVRYQAQLYTVQAGQMTMTAI